MRCPIKHPEDFRFQLSRIGIDPSNDTQVVYGYGCLHLLEHIVHLRKWRLPFAAYKNEDVHKLLADVFPEATEAFDRNLGSSDYWKSFADAYDAAVKMPAETFIRNVCPNFVTDPNACVHILSLKMSETKGDFTPLTQCLHLIFTWRSKSESMEQAYAVYEDLALRLELAAVPWEDFAYLYKDLLTKWRADPFCGKIIIGGMQHDGAPKQTNGNAFRRYRVTDSRNPPAAEDRADGIL